MKILITGAAGFIGYHLARYHLEQGDSVILVDNLFKTNGQMDTAFGDLIQQPKVQYLAVDLTKPTIEFSSIHSIDIVYHLAAINGTQLFYEIPYQVARANLLMVLILLEELEKKSIGKLVYASTSEVYADSEQVGILRIPTNEQIPVVFTQPTQSRFSYGTSKFMGEFLCFYFGQQSNIPTSVVRYHNVYGPRMGHRHVIPEFIARIRSRENPFRIYGGRETRAFCYIEDAVKATYLVATTSNCDKEIIHIGNSSEEIAIENLAKLMMDQMGEHFELVECGRRTGSVSRRCPDTSKLRNLTAFSANVNLEQGLRATIQWYLAN